jgi:predicted phage replisome organizer
MSEIKDNNKVYYWIKLKTDFFESDAIDFLLSQKDGCQYVALYLKLCAMTANTNGVLASKVGNMLIPYSVEKIARDTKFFSADTVRVALELYKNLRLINVSDDNVLHIANFDAMIGNSKTDEHTKKLGAERQKRYRERQKALSDNVTVTQDVTLFRNVESRVKSLESRDKSLDKSVSSQKLDSGVTRKSAKNENVQTDLTDCFVKPSISEIVGYIQEHNLNVDAKKFWKHYESTGWKTGNDPIRDWRGLLKKWSKAEREEDNPGTGAIQLDEKFYAKPVQMPEEQLQSELAQLQEKIKNGEL